MIGTFVDAFISTNVQYTPITDIEVNGWDNGEAMYDADNAVINDGLTLTITNSGCPDCIFFLPFYLPTCILLLFSFWYYNGDAKYDANTTCISYLFLFI